jgi:FkbM family methyltransferase
MVRKVFNRLMDGLMRKHLARRLAYYYALIFATPRLAGFHYFLLNVALRGLGIMNYYDHAVSGEDFLVSKLLPRIVQNKESIFFDVGANLGEYSMMLAEKFPKSKIFAFEPHPGNFEILSKAKIPNLLPFKLALSNVRGTINLYDVSGTETSQHASVHQGVISELHQQTEFAFTVKTDTLSSFVKSNAISYIDFLKIDTEGNELSILEGGRSLMQQNRIGMIQFEFNEMNVFSGSFFYNFSHLLENFILYRLLPHGLLPLPQNPLLTELFGFQNILAIPKDKVHLL